MTVSAGTLAGGAKYDSTYGETMAATSRFGIGLFIAVAVHVVAPIAHGEDLAGWKAETIAPAQLRMAPPPARQGNSLGRVKRLTLRDAISRTLAHHPAVRAAGHEIDAREGEAYQASRRPNPELLLEVENFGGSKDKSGFDVAEETLGLTQLIELGGKRMLRLLSAEIEVSLASWDYETVRMRMATLAAQSFVDVLAAQERVKVLDEFVEISERTRKSVEARVGGGKASPIELDRALVAAARAKSALRAEQTRLDAAKRKLSSLWGAQASDFAVAAGRLGNGAHAPSVGALKRYLDENPTLARWSDEVSRRAAQVDTELARSIPDVRLGLGVRRFNENDSTALIASVGIPLPIFDRNEGNIAAAESRLAKARSDAEATRDELLRALIEATGELEVAATQLTVLKRDVLPVAQTAFDRTKIGYDEGKFDILNVLDVQRSVFEVRLDLLNARADYEKARVKVEALIGRDIHEFKESAGR